MRGVDANEKWMQNPLQMQAGVENSSAAEKYKRARERSTTCR